MAPKHAIDHVARVEGEHVGHVAGLCLELLPAFRRRRVDVVDHGVAVRFECPGEVFHVQVDHAERQAFTVHASSVDPLPDALQFQ